MAKRYWLKLNAHFFKDSHILYLKTQKNGFEYIYLWQSLLLKCLEVDDSEECGFLRLNEKIPYTPDLLSEIFNLNIDIIKAAIELFVNLGMMEILSDGTLYIESVQKLIGKESESAERVRLHREKKKEIESDTKLLQCNIDVTKCNPILIKNKNKNKKEDEEAELLFFDELWNLYDKKTNRKKAIVSFSKIKAFPDNINQIIIDYVASTPDKKYRKDFTTWLNGECWHDEIYKPPKTPEEIIRDEALQVLAEMRKQDEEKKNGKK